MSKMEADAPTPQQPSVVSGPQINSPVDLARFTAGIVLMEASNLGEINPAMARRLSERMDQVFLAAARGATISWGPGGDILITYPPVVNPILEAAKARKAKRELEASTSSMAINTHHAGIPEDIEQANDAEDKRFDEEGKDE